MIDAAKWFQDNISWLAVVGSIFFTATAAYVRMGYMQASMVKLQDTTDSLQATAEFNRQEVSKTNARLDTLTTVVTGALGVQERLKDHEDRIRSLELRRG